MKSLNSKSQNAETNFHQDILSESRPFKIFVFVNFRSITTIVSEELDAALVNIDENNIGKHYPGTRQEIGVKFQKLVLCL